MHILELSMTNFRQFFGRNVIRFGNRPGQAITIIHGVNGSGKTSILNAFKWAFYGKTDFDTREVNILNEQAIGEAASDSQINLSVVVKFEHDEIQYELTREQYFRKSDGMNVKSIGGDVATLSWIDSNGVYEKSNNPDNQINQILPEKLHTYFLFNGERIEKLANLSSSGQIRDAIRSLMGLEIVDRAQIHLSKKVVSKFQRELKGTSEKTLDEVLDKQSELSDQKEELESQLSDIQNNKNEFAAEISEISSRMRANEAAAELQKERENIESRLEELKVELNAADQGIARAISQRGFLAFFEEPANKVAGMLEERRQKGELPFKVRAQFIDDLLERERCICGAPLHHGSEAHTTVSAYKKDAGSPGLEEAFMNTTGPLKHVQPDRENLYRELRDLSSRKSKLQEEQAQRHGRLDEISNDLGKGEIEDIIKLEERRRQIEGERENCVREEGSALGKLKQVNSELEDLEKDISEQSEKSEKGKLIRRRIDVAKECARVLTDLHEALAHKTREDLSSRFNGTFQRIIRKGYWAEIDQDYNLQIYKDIPGHGKQLVADKSTGESQVTSLSFIGSIIALAKERSQKGTQFFRGGNYPIVMDSPFGALDDEYRQFVARLIPELADQIIMLVSSSQWKGAVADECSPRIGAQYSLVYHSPNVKPDEINQYRQRADEYEFTTIEEGYHG